MAFLGGVFALVEEDELAGAGEEDDDAHLEERLRESMEWRGSSCCLFGGEIPFPALKRLRGERAGGAAGRQGVVGGPFSQRIHATTGSMERRASQERACRVVMRLGLT